jgi:hypothetical protein
MTAPICDACADAGAVMELPCPIHGGRRRDHSHERAREQRHRAADAHLRKGDRTPVEFAHIVMAEARSRWS